MRMLLAIALALSLAGCSLDAEVEMQRVCGTVVNQTFPGAPIGGTAEQTFDYDLGSAVPDLSQKGFSGEAYMREVTVATTGPSRPDLSGITVMKFTLMPQPGSAAQPVDLLSYTRPADARPPVYTITSAGESANVFESLRSRRLKVKIAASGTPPTTAWSADVKVCLMFKITINYLEAASN